MEESIITKHPLNIFFDKIYCINTLENTERREDVSEKFKLLGIEVEFFNTVRYDLNQQLIDIYNKGKKVFKFDAEVSCAMSHYSCIKKAKLKNYRNVLILEDDVTFVRNFNEVIKSYLELVPDDWDVLYFYSGVYGWNLKHKFLDNTMKIFKSANVNGTLAYAVNNKMYSSILEEYDSKFDISDNLFSKRMQKDNKYIFYSVYPNLCAQHKNTSTINPNPKDIINVFPHMITFGDLKEEDYL